MHKHVLLIDDDIEEAELFRDILTAIDPSIAYQYAVNGEEALIQLTDHSTRRPDIIFLDINMPEMNGWECLKYLKATPSLKQIPVIMYSTSSRENDRQLANRLGAKYFFTKSADYREFKREVEALLLPFSIFRFLKINFREMIPQPMAIPSNG